jgi:hypothetical protein
MSHHGNQVPRELSEAMQKLLGEYPNGRLNKDDAGALAVAIGHESGAVTIQFPKPVAWIGFTPEQAIGIAETLISHARKAGAANPLTLKLGG